MKRAKQMPRPRPDFWRPTGFYKNRPWLLAKYAANGLGRLENVRFITSPQS